MTTIVERSERLVAGPAEALAGLLGVPMPDLDRGLPMLWHWVYLLDRPAQADLGPDGHPIRNAVPEPPEPGLRRMWAGGQVRVRGVLRCGERVTRQTRVLGTQRKTGRTGPLTFVTVGHRILQRDRILVEERQDLVYRAASAADARAHAQPEPLVVAPRPEEWSIDTSAALLFRFSALTYNAHRIHYDRDYARAVEGYPGLLVHGPLQALAMAEAVRARGCTGAQVFDYRLLSPLFDHQGLVVSAAADAGALTTVARDRYGRRTATGSMRPVDDTLAARW
ncbi:MaoC family dehydratase N-terminal domain-containing protein [Nocardia halotolerans]|uniref:MaoC family dehydratase N-terminal domain-containing protein n=1 Tax=Nocardia halotolerans TaxID=1755878 RepID=A0ABV8VKU2_9NOCA